MKQPGNGIIVKGFVSEEELADLYRNCRIVVVPLRYGAGVKGKVVEAIYNGAPIVTTSVGSEGIPDVEKARQPMFTTGGAERSGMGFTIMESFMDQLSVRSAAGKGTTVVMKKRLASRVKAAK